MPGQPASQSSQEAENLGNRIWHETIPVADLPEIYIRETTPQEKLFPAEQAAVAEFISVAGMYQEQADAMGGPVYLRYVYGRGNNGGNSFLEVDPFREEEGTLFSPTVVADADTKLGPIFCIYPTDVTEIYLHDEHGLRRPAGFTVPAAQQSQSNHVWFPDLLRDNKNQQYGPNDTVEAVPMGEGAVIDDRAQALMVTELLHTRGDEEMRPFICGYRNGAMTFITPGIETVGLLRQHWAKSPGFLGEATRNALEAKIYASLSPTDTMKMQMQLLGSVMGYSVFDGHVTAPSIKEYTTKGSNRANYPVLENREQEVIRQVTEALKSARVPRESLVAGDLVELLATVGIAVNDMWNGAMSLNVNLPEFEAILKSVGAYKLDFLGMTLPFIPQYGRHVTPALQAEGASVPYPLVRRVVISGGQLVSDTMLNSGTYFPPTSAGQCYVIPEVQMGKGKAVAGEAVSFVPTGDGEWIVMPNMAMSAFSRRIMFHPVLGIIHMEDRERTETSEGARHSVSTKYTESPKMEPGEAEATVALLSIMDAQNIFRVVGDTEWRSEYVERISRMYAAAGIMPSLGIYTYVIDWAQLDRDQIDAVFGAGNTLTVRGMPYVSAIHSAHTYSNETRLAQELIRQIKAKYPGKEIVIPTIHQTKTHKLLLEVVERNFGPNCSASIKVNLNRIRVCVQQGQEGRYVTINIKNGPAVKALRHIAELPTKRAA